MAKSESQQSVKKIMISEKSYKLISKRPNGTIRVQTVNEDPSLTDPQWAKQADINEIMFKHQGMTTHLNKRPAYYSMDELVPSMTLTEAAEISRRAMDQFNQLPASTRERFNNDPGLLHDFLLDPKNTEEAVKLKLINKTQVQKNDELNDNNNEPKNKNKKSEPAPQPPEPK